MSREHELVALVLCDSGLDASSDIVRNGLPGLVEAAMRLATRAEAADVVEAEVQVRDPVVDGARAPEGQDQQLVGQVGGEKAGYVAVVIFAGSC